MTEFQLHEILQNVKPVSFITEDYKMTILEVSIFYNVTYKAISTTIDRNRHILESDGIVMCRGQELRKLKQKNTKIDRRTSTLILLSPLSVCRLAFYLSESNITNQIKDKILNADTSLYSYLSQKENVLVKKHEMEMGYLLTQLIGKYHKIGQQIPCGKFRIDFLIDNFIAIEVDEDGHSSYNKDNERTREKFIKSKGYKIFRYDTRTNNILEFLGDVINELNTKTEGVC